MTRAERQRVAQTLREMADSIDNIMRELGADSEMEHNVRSLYVAKMGVLRTADKLAGKEDAETVPQRALTHRKPRSLARDKAPLRKEPP